MNLLIAKEKEKTEFTVLIKIEIRTNFQDRLDSCGINKV
jgi:hypothetical protein